MVPDMGDQDRGIQTAVIDVPITLAQPAFNPTPDEEKILPNTGECSPTDSSLLSGVKQLHRRCVRLSVIVCVVWIPGRVCRAPWRGTYR